MPFERYDRDAAVRAAPELLAAAWRSAGARLLDTAATVQQCDGAAVLRLRDCPGELPADAVYLGRLDGVPVFTVVGESRGCLLDGGMSPPVGAFLRGCADSFSAAETQLLFTALALEKWHLGHTFTDTAGAASAGAAVPDTLTSGGWVRRDSAGHDEFPRTDPAVIVRIVHEDRLLLGTSVGWEPGRFSLLAGFVEAGESVEDAICREVFEECGLRTTRPRYLRSQPWPFPRSLMLGFEVVLEAGQDPAAAVPQPGEIAALRWFTRDELRCPEPGIILPSGVSLAHWMIQDWLGDV